MAASRMGYLLTQHFNQGATADEAAELSRLLVDEDQAAAEFWRYADFEQLLLHGLRAEGFVADAPRPRFWRRLARAASHELALSLLISGLFITAALLTLALWTLPQWRSIAVSQRPAIVAEITRTQEAVWNRASDDAPQDRQLFAGDRLRLAGGLVEVTFRKGAVALLEGPAEFVVDHAEGGTLTKGKLAARVDAPHRDFTVDTPWAKVTDLGTEFGVAVDDAGVQCVCFQGRIALHPHVEQATTVELATGERATVTASGQILRSPPAAEFPPIVQRLPPRNSGVFRVVDLPAAGEPLFDPAANFTHLIDFTPDDEPAAMIGNRRCAAVPVGHAAALAERLEGADAASGRRWSISGYTHALHNRNDRAIGYGESPERDRHFDAMLLSLNQHPGPNAYAVLTLYGLTPGRDYMLSIPTAPWSGIGDERVARLRGSEGGALQWNQQSRPALLQYRYTATASSMQLRIEHQSIPEASWHLYGFANQELNRDP